MKLQDLCRAAALNCPAGKENVEITAVTENSERVRPGCIFICVRGFHTDGHTLIAAARTAGAAAVAVEDGAEYEIFPDLIYLHTKDAREASAMLFDAWYGKPTARLKIIGVTGTNGKTSVTNFLRSILEAAGCRCGLIGTVGCESVGRHLESHPNNPLANMTTPDPEDLYRLFSEMVADRVEYVLMEVTSHALALGKLAPITFEAAVFTNLTPEHLDFHKTMDAYAEAKAKLFSKSKLSVINTDSPYAGTMIAAAGGKTVTCSPSGETADYTVGILTPPGGEGVTYRLRSRNRSLSMRCPVPGKFTVANSMQAAVLALELGLAPLAVRDALAATAGVPGRMERVRTRSDFSVLIDYAHTPDALENLLRTARDFSPSSRIVLVFGCGGDRDRSKRPVMGRLASALADRVILTSDNPRGEDPRQILNEILSGMDPKNPPTVIEDRAEAIRTAVREAKKNDLVILAGKGHEEYEITRDGRKPFSEKAIVESALCERAERKYYRKTESGQ